jgi:diguanylate cyclase (GGDEF)-like protein
LTLKHAVFTEFELRGVGGRRFWVRDFSRAVKGSDGKIAYFDGILVDITEQTKAAKKLERTLDKLRATNKELAGLSLTDELTGLHNRRGFFTLGQQQMKIAKRIRKEVFLVFLDIDNLKKTNDSFGHSAGDKLLAGVAAILRTTLREADVIARIGGDEFAVLAMRSKTSSEKMLLRRINEQVRLFNRKETQGHPLSLSMGIVRYDPKKYATLEDLLTQADFLMYQQKRSKQNSTPDTNPSRGEHLI